MTIMRIILLIGALSFLSLAQSFAQNEENQYLTSKGDLHLLGTISRSQLKEEPFSKWYNTVYESYSIDEERVEKVNEYYDEGISVKIYLGTWCGDSKREVTRFLKIVDHSIMNMNNVELIGLDNRAGKMKQGPNREEEGLNIHRVPTFLFYKDGEEVGRIVEGPVSSLETDIAQIFAGLAPRPDYHLANYLLTQFEEESLDAVDTLITKNASFLRHYSKNEGELNTLGYVLMDAGKYDQAIIAFRLNTLIYPESGNTFDSLGEAYLRVGDSALATTNYLKSLQLDATNENATKVLLAMLKDKESR